MKFIKISIRQVIMDFSILVELYIGSIRSDHGFSYQIIKAVSGGLTFFLLERGYGGLPHRKQYDLICNAIRGFGGFSPKEGV